MSEYAERRYEQELARLQSDVDAARCALSQTQQRLKEHEARREHIVRYHELIQSMHNLQSEPTLSTRWRCGVCSITYTDKPISCPLNSLNCPTGYVRAGWGSTGGDTRGPQ